MVAAVKALKNNGIASMCLRMELCLLTLGNDLADDKFGCHGDELWTLESGKLSCRGWSVMIETQNAYHIKLSQ